MNNPASAVFTLNASTFTAITIAHSDTGRAIAAVTSDSSAWVFSDDLAGTVALTVPAPGTYSNGSRKDDDGVLFYAKASAGTPTLSLFVGLASEPR